MADENHKNLLLSWRDSTLEYRVDDRSGSSKLDSPALADELRKFVESADLPDNATAWCLMPASGVTLRRIKLPPTTPANREQFLRLQIEREFPLSPEEMAWGWQELSAENGSNEILVAAVKEERVRPIAQALQSTGITVKFVPEILVRGADSASRDALAVVDSSDHLVEFAKFKDGTPVSIRTFSRNGDDTAKTADRIRASADGSTKLQFSGDKVLAAAIDSGFEGSFESTANDGMASLIRLIAGDGIDRVPTMKAHESDTPTTKATTELPTRWLAVAAVLVVALIGTRYLGPFFGEARLKRQLAAIEEKQTGFPAINQEVNFLQHIQKNQPPYLAVLAVFGDAAPRGTKIESLSMDRRGEFSFRGKLQSSQNASDLRRKLIESGLFTDVVLDEQSTVPNKREVNVRFTARWNTDPKAKSDVLKRIDAKGKKDDSKK